MRAVWLVLMSGCVAAEIGPSRLALPADDAGEMRGPIDSSQPAMDASDLPIDDAGFPPDASDPIDAEPPIDAGQLTEQEEKEQAILQLINAQRGVASMCGGQSFGPSPPLEMDDALHRAARNHSIDMATQDYFDHTSLDGRSPFQRMADEGYRGAPFGENIAGGSSTAEATFGQWLGSVGHCTAMLHPFASRAGVGYAFDEDATWRHYWTLTLGQ